MPSTPEKALRLDARLSPVMAEMVQLMTERTPEERPSIEAVVKALMSENACALDRRRPRPIRDSAGGERRISLTAASDGIRARRMPSGPSRAASCGSR